jgi:hypothetical protein
MGRELKRVPLNFDWPKDKVWQGFLNPHYKGHCQDCDECEGSGSTSALNRLSDLVSLLMISGEDAKRGKCHPYLSQAPLHHTQGKVPSKEMVQLTAGLAGREPSFLGHDSCDNWRATKKIIAAAGLPEKWGYCPKCLGEGSVWDSQENKAKAENWQQEQPPTGEGYQLWETVSEGSPCSPVFDSPEGLAHWLATSPDYKGRMGNTSYDQWMKFICGDGWAPSLVMVGGQIMSGVDAV